MNDTAIKIVSDFIDKNLTDPQIYWAPGMFLQRSYERWAAYEIINKLLDKPFDPPLETIEAFMYESSIRSTFYEALDNEDKAYMFSIAAYISETILRLFL